MNWVGRDYAQLNCDLFRLRIWLIKTNFVKTLMGDLLFWLRKILFKLYPAVVSRTISERSLSFKKSSSYRIYRVDTMENFLIPPPLLYPLFLLYIILDSAIYVYDTFHRCFWNDSSFLPTFRRVYTLLPHIDFWRFENNTFHFVELGTRNHEKQ